MAANPVFSVIVPVFNRPGELAELLASLQSQTFQDFEVVVIEDGSTLRSEAVVAASPLSIQYHFKENSGPGPSRNVGFSLARGKYFVVLDSDCLCPPHYLATLHQSLQMTPLDLWGGPDAGHEAFTPLQQAMAYTMSAFLTTGGIRGGRKKAFQPRSFNMGMTRSAWERTGGFQFARYAEDIELSMRAVALGLTTGLISEAFVYHKRRTSLAQFFKQVYHFGMGRVHVGQAHPGAIKLTHWIPTLFLIFTLLLPAFWLLGVIPGLITSLLWLGYLLAIGVGALGQTRKGVVGLLAMPSALVQLMGYGLGFIVTLWTVKTGKS